VKERLKSARERAAERAAAARRAVGEATLPAVEAPGLPGADAVRGATDDQESPPADVAPSQPQADAAPGATDEQSSPADVAPSVPQTDGAPAGADDSGGMAEATFWRLIEETRAEAGDDTGSQSELLEERLTQLPPTAIVEFARIRRRLDEGAYTNDLWGAATVIEDGCSDDCFRDFRGYLILLGRRPYESALRDPDFRPPRLGRRTPANWENADDVAPDAYATVTGADFPLEESDLSGSLRGAPFDQDDTAALTSRYPQLAARFR
jgi:hypothetical protein